MGLPRSMGFPNGNGHATASAGRLRLGLNQTELGLRIGVSQKAVSQLERGEILQPRIEVIKNLAQVLEVNLDDVLEAMVQFSLLSPERQRQVQEVINPFAVIEQPETS
jgi:transcriptional regulator with XRE-family HTH domain